MSKFPKIRSTTVVAVKRNGCVAMAGDGQVTNGQTVMKGNAKKVRKIYDGKIITGFAGSVADAFFNSEVFDRNRILKQPEYEASGRSNKSSFYILSADVGRKG